MTASLTFSELCQTCGKSQVYVRNLLTSLSAPVHKFANVLTETRDSSTPLRSARNDRGKPVIPSEVEGSPCRPIRWCIYADAYLVPCVINTMTYSANPEIPRFARNDTFCHSEERSDEESQSAPDTLAYLCRCVLRTRFFLLSETGSPGTRPGR